MRGFKQIVAGGLLAVGAVFALTTSQTPAEAADCSPNAVIKCGVSSMNEFRSKYKSSKSTQNIFSWYGITSSMVNGSNVKNGYVTKSGNVVVDGTIVASGALTGGRQAMPNSTKRTYAGTTFYSRTPAASFQSNSLSAFVLFDNYGRFTGAVIKDCGNPVKATPKTGVSACKSLTRTQVSRLEHKFTTSVTRAANTKVVDYTYNFGDGKTATTSKSSVSHKYAKAGTYTVTVKVRFEANGVKYTKNCQTKLTIKELTPGVSIDKKVDGVESKQVKVGQAFTYGLTIKNTGKVTLKNAVVTDNAPSGVQFISSDKGSVSGNKLSYSIPSLAPGASTTVAIKAKVTAYKAGAIVNTACVDAKEVNPGSNKPDDCDDATVTVEKPVVKIEVCDLETDTVITIDEEKFDKSKHTKNLEECDDVQVCNPETGEIVTVPKNDEDKYVPVDSEKCADVPVCNPETGEIVTVPKKDENNYEPTDSEKCAEKPVTPEPEKPALKTPEPQPEVATELPKTGLESALQSLLGLGSLTAASYYYITSRRN